MMKSTLLLTLLQLFAITTTNAARVMDARARPSMQQPGMVGAQDAAADEVDSAQQNMTEPQTSYVYLPHQLAQAGKLDDLKQLLEDYPDLVNDVDNFGWSLMHEAGRSGSTELAEYLIEKGAKLNPRSNEGHTPLYEADRFNGPDSKIVQFLLQKGAKFDTPQQRLRGAQEEITRNFAHTLAANGRLEELKEYVRKHGSSEFLKAPDSLGWTCLMEAARFGHLDMVVYLLKQNVNVHYENKVGQKAVDVALQFQGKSHSVYRMLDAVTR
jgi:ankyrin repeat protein